MEENTKRKKGGRNKKNPEETASKTVGGFRLTQSQADLYLNLFRESRHKTETDFFKDILFNGKIKLFYSDENTEKIYYKLTDFVEEINKIGKNFNQITRRVNAVSDDKIIYDSLEEAKQEFKKLQEKLDSLKPIFLKYSSSKIREQ